MDSTAITNYDVLVEPPLDGSPDGDYQLAKHKNHVGNNRLKVFLDLYQDAYNTARDRGEIRECNKIVDKIVSTVCHECVPNGRFLVSTTFDNGVVLWNAMDENTAKEMIHQVLEPRQQAMPAASISATRDDEGLKRRRRSSLLRRSASEGMLSEMIDMVDFIDIDKKKITRIDEGVSENWSSMPSVDDLFNLNRMDVILTDSGNRLDLDPNSQSVGNNRLHVLIAMQAGQYKDATPDGQDRILNEVVNTVKMFWKGRFLVESEFGYEELPRERCKEALEAIFRMRCGQRLGQRPLRHSVPFIAQVPMTRPIVPRQASMSVLSAVPEPVVGVPGVQDMRSAAVKSLQKQKQRQNIANRLEQISRRNITHTPLSQNQSIGLGMQGMQKRESTVLGNLDPGIMEQLFADCEAAPWDDDDEPLPPSNPNEFGNRFNGADGFG